MTVLAIIPARYGSTRFPGKPLAMLAGRPVVRWVYESVRSVITDVVVATDDVRIAEAVEAFGGVAVMTSAEHTSGTSRVCEAFAKLSGGRVMPNDGYLPKDGELPVPNFCKAYDVVLNVQGDEPFVSRQHLRSLLDCLDRNPQADIATLVSPFDPSASIESLTDPNRIKVVTDAAGGALYFSRSVVPYVRDCPMDQWPTRVQYLIHVGVYAFRSSVFDCIASLSPSPLARAENLEQLTWLQAGLRIATRSVTAPTVGIDTPADLDRANDILSKH